MTPIRILASSSFKGLRRLQTYDLGTTEHHNESKGFQIAARFVGRPDVQVNKKKEAPFVCVNIPGIPVKIHFRNNKECEPSPVPKEISVSNLL
jgi:hypothetical protein